mmetsp:Transcript_13168/g.21838  ORF Transcript_13168/g.21838 Transcript_13168/m.21838 type:complete len:149 (+) Transcript_13168:45-491(+)
MKVQNLLLLLIASIGVCGASASPLRERILAGKATNTTSTTILYDDDAPSDDDAHADDDAAIASLPVGDFGASSDDAAAEVGDDDRITLDESSNTTLFKAPKEVEPLYWKEFVAGFFLFCATVLCILTARKTCCKKNEYQHIPSVTLVV